jgi:hypothetical protein
MRSARRAQRCSGRKKFDDSNPELSAWHEHKRNLEFSMRVVSEVRLNPLDLSNVSCTVEVLASRHYFSQHRADFTVDDDIRPAVHVGRLAVDNGERGAVGLCNHR